MLVYINLGLALIANLWCLLLLLRFRRQSSRHHSLEQRHDQTRLELVTLRRRSYALAADAKLARSARAPKFTIEFRAERGEDAVLWDIFEGQMEGFFIDAGSYDGYTNNVTYAFEAMGWTGMLIEANPTRYRQCVARRSRSQVVHAALGPKSSTATTKFMVPDAEGRGLLSLHAGEMLGHGKHLNHPKLVIGSRWRRGAKSGKRARGVANGLPPGKLVEVEVPLRALNDVLAGHLGGIDLVVVDVGVNDFEVLRGFDLAHFRPRVILVEDNSAGRSERLVKFLSGAGYTLAGWIGVSQIHVRNDEREMLRRARELCPKEPVVDDRV